MSPRRLAIAGLAASMLAAPVAASGADSNRIEGPKKRSTATTVDASRFLWATVNVCDTAKAPDTIGIRGSMPGARDGRENMYMRFQVQFFSEADGRWHELGESGDSGFVFVGKARYESRQAGRSFRIVPRGERVLLRGIVTFEWRLKGEVVRRAKKRTTADRRPGAGADPAGYSESNCRIRR